MGSNVVLTGFSVFKGFIRQRHTGFIQEAYRSPRLRRRWKHGMPEQVSASTEARCYGRGFGRQGGKESRNRLEQEQRQGGTEKAWAGTEARWHGKGMGRLGGTL